jgi:hypothetical protein
VRPIQAPLLALAPAARMLHPVVPPAAAQHGAAEDVGALPGHLEVEEPAAAEVGVDGSPMSVEGCGRAATRRRVRRRRRTRSIVTLRAGEGSGIGGRATMRPMLRHLTLRLRGG